MNPKRAIPIRCKLWGDQYLPPVVNNITGGHGHELMLAVGVIEVVAGLGVWFKPKVFAYVVAAWPVLIIINLLMIPAYVDVALRDLGLSLGAWLMGVLATNIRTNCQRASWYGLVLPPRHAR